MGKYVDGTKITDLTGVKFGRYTIIGLDKEKYAKDKERVNNKEIKRFNPHWFCRCSCDNKIISRSVSSQEIKDDIGSCGCLKSDMVSKRSEIIHTKSLYQYILEVFNINDYNIYWSSKNTISPHNLNYKTNKKVWIKCQNNKEHPDFEIKGEVVSSRKNLRCPICSCKIHDKKFNSISVVYPELIKYFCNKKEADDNFIDSHKNVMFKCPHCGSLQEYSINKLIKRGGLNCKVCMGGSYPERFMYSFLQKIGVDLVTQLSKTKLDWVDEYRYDFYIPSISCIIETHGDQHYTGSFGRIGGRSLEEEQSNDKLKRELALNNGIEHYIELDCRKSEMEWIKNSVMSSELPELLNFKETDIDWDCVAVDSFDSVYTKIRELWNSGINNTKEISEEVGLTRGSVIKILHKLTVLGQCNYDSKSNHALFNYLNSKKRSIYVLRDNKIVLKCSSIKELCSLSESILGVKLFESNVINVAKGRQSHHKGYTFKYA